MRVIGIAAVTASLILTAAHAPARAEQVCMGLTAKVTFVRDDAGVLGGDVQVGDTISGAYLYESTAPDAAPEPEAGYYPFRTAPYGVVLNVGGIVFRTNPARLRFDIVLVDQSRPFCFRQLRRLFDKSVPINSETENDIGWQLDDFNGTALTSPDLTAEPPVLSDWDANFR
jgi:hypothetical protein